MTKRFLVLLLMVSAAGLFSTAAFAQQDPIDAGLPDTVEMVFSVVPDFTTNQLQFQADLYVTNDANTLKGTSMGFTWSNPNLQMDSAVVPADIQSAFDLGTFVYEDADIATTNANQRFIFGGAQLFSAGLQPQATPRLWASYYFTLSNWGECDSIVIDTLQFSNGTEWLMVSEAGDYIAQWAGAEKYTDTACSISGNIVLSVDSLVFEAVEGGSNPAGQTFGINSDATPLDFTLNESVSWFSLSPILGTTPATITVLPNIIGLAAGTYVDSVEVVAASALNSPQYVKIILNVIEPPPVIGVQPSALFFNAIVGGSNPADKFLTITNEGGRTLEWSVSSSSPWLSLSPTFGTDSGQVTVSVDITGLPFGDYSDTILITDPEASNDPLEVPVSLSVASDLPVIAVDSAFNFVVVETASRAVDPRVITVRNAGAGSMNFWIEENSTRLFTVNPDSGQAPEDVTVGFKVTTGVSGDDYFDTLWVFSNEAVNSPFPVVFQFHLQSNPANMYVSRDTALIQVYECENGADALPPTETFNVLNIGGDDPMDFIVSGESDLFDVQLLVNTAPSTVTLTSNYLDLPIGTYWDTLVVYAQKSIDPIDTVFVKYEVIPGDEQPKIWVNQFQFTLSAQENHGPIEGPGFTIRNANGGCMEWFINEDVPWLFPEDTTGLNPASIDLGVNPAGYTFGEYKDSMIISAPTASNSPGTVRLTLRIWRFHGDNDWNAQINVADLTYLVRYLFQQGPAPFPHLFVGDMNCNKLVDIADLTYLVDYLFNNGPIACGNPYK